ncbi:TPR-like protein [Suillus bovinus]|uniref:TPR-like protein n=1 Tax=Suillus bovinus TaxID=48563 RepID=UPI001B885124|nr:TPR-like protein [Suillus bovinus]KAG2130834.1 TPR-like protein [Suillus bovinus]
MSDLSKSINIYRAALALYPPDDPDQSTSLNGLASSLRNRYLRQGDMSDLSEAIELSQAALTLCPPGHPDRSTSLNNLANCIVERFEERGVLSDLDDSIKFHRDALALRPLGHPERSMSLNNLAYSLRISFQQRGMVSALDEVIELHRDALLLRPPGHPHRWMSLNNLAINLEDRFEQRGMPSDLDEAIDVHRAAARDLCVPGHFNESLSLSNTATSLHTRFLQRGAPSDLDEAIKLNQAALDLRPLGHPHRSTSLNNLANNLQERFLKWGVLSDLDEAIKLHRAALDLRPLGHPKPSTSLSNLAMCLHEKFQQCGNLSDLDEAINLHRAALLHRPPGHSDRSMSLNNLAISIHSRFQLQGAPSDLDEVIKLHRAALELRPLCHSHRSMSLNNLAVSLRDRFMQHTIASDLDESIELHRAALELRPPGHSDRATSLVNLANSIKGRFKQRGIIADLDESIELYRAALMLHPSGHPHRSSTLNNLASVLRSRFKLKGVQSDLDESMNLHRTTLELCPPGHHDRHLFLTNLAVSIGDRVKSDLDEAVRLHRAALMLCPPGHSDRSLSLNNLAASLRNRFGLQRDLSDLDESIDLHRAALGLRPLGHLERFTSINNLVICLQDRFHQQGLISDLNESFMLYSQLSQLEVSHVISLNDLSIALTWVASAKVFKHSSALLAYQTALNFLDRHLAVMMFSSHHFDAIKKEASSLAMDAFSYSVSQGALTTAVELVEQGRAVFWTQSARFRTPLDELSASGDAGNALADEAKDLSFRLRTALETSTEGPQTRQLIVQWDDVVSRIRMLPRFSRFLQPPLFSDLQKAAEYGPVIIVNASQYSCDALVVLIDQDPIHIPLDITQAEVSELSSEFQSLIKHAGSSDSEAESYKIIDILRKLWDPVVRPIVVALRKFIPRGSRIWWCPTAKFTLLPLHAAGPYAPGAHDFSHFYISSYTPTLATLVRARKQLSKDASNNHFVAIGQANAEGGTILQRVADELVAVAQRVAPFTSFTSIEDSDATVQGALDVLRKNQWVHLACHGFLNRDKPFNASFAMRDSGLMIRDIIQAHLQNPEFAFLSACHTTVGDESSPDEAIHLAAAMQFSGFRGVVGSMWSVNDGAACQIVSAFYDNMFDSSGRLDPTRAAVALHKAVKKLRKTIPLEQQIVFIHIGI